jgi:hypothetical protein
VVGMIIHNNRAVGAKTATETAHNEIDNPAVGKPTANVKVLDGKLTDNEEAEGDADLGAGGVGSGVEVRTVDRAGNFFHGATGEPGAEDVEIVLCLVSPCGHTLFEVVLGETKANELVVGDVV